MSESNITIEQAAEICHELNRVYCRSLGDTSQPTWPYAPDWQKESAINGVKFHMDHPDAKASQSHESWLEEKRSTGWTYGEVKDPEKKEHPCMVDFKDLPLDQQVKDVLFKNTVEALRCIIRS